MLAVICGAVFIAVEVMRSISKMGNSMPPGYSTGSGEGTEAMPGAHAAIPPGAYPGYGGFDSAPERARFDELRARLDAQGYSAVKFRLDVDTLILYGSVPTEYDRFAVQAICFATLGLSSLSDDLTVSDTDPED